MALEGLVQRNLDQMKRQRFGPLYGSGIVYAREDPGETYWQTIREVYATKRADCEDLSAALVSKYRASGVDPRARVDLRPGGAPGLWHVFVRRGDGSIEDPSKVLGMR